MDQHSFCRALLAEIMPEVRAKFTREEIRSAWVYNTGYRGRPCYEFHGPNDHFDHNLRTADCAFSAKAEGWSRLLGKLEDEAAEKASPTVR
jgi:hypothetical protein